MSTKQIADLVEQVAALTERFTATNELVIALREQVASLQADVSLVPIVVEKRRAGELAAAQQRDRDMLALPPDQLYQALAECPHLQTLLQSLGNRAVDIVKAAPDELRTKWAAMLAPQFRNRVELALAREAGEVPHHVWVTTAPGITMRFPNVEISKQHAEALVAVGLGDSVSYRQRPGKSNDWYFDPPSVHHTARTRLSVEQLEAVRNAAPDFNAAIIFGDVLVNDHTADEDDAVFLKAREHAESFSSKTIGEYIHPRTQGHRYV